jgi:hypothetical protein
MDHCMEGAARRTSYPVIPLSGCIQGADPHCLQRRLSKTLELQSGGGAQDLLLFL